MSTIWLDKAPGALPSATDLDGTTMMLIGAPDYIRLPAELGGASEDVTGIHAGECPQCDASARHYRLESLCVAECSGSCGFVWYRERTE